MWVRVRVNEKDTELYNNLEQKKEETTLTPTRFRLNGVSTYVLLNSVCIKFLIMIR